MKKHNSYFSILFVNITIIVLIFLFLYEEKSLTNMINSLFYITVFYMTVFFYLLITKGKFFDGITYGIRRFREIVVRRDEDIDRIDKLLPSERVNLQVYNIFKWQFYSLLTLLVILQIIYFII